MLYHLPEYLLPYHWLFSFTADELSLSLFLSKLVVTELKIANFHGRLETVDS